MKLVFTPFLFSFLAFGADVLEGDLLNALEGSDWAREYQTRSTPATSSSSTQAADPQIEGNRTSQDLECNEEKDRNTVPYKFLLGLLANKSLSISHDPHSGVLKFDGGIMIGNCQSMLETVVSKPNESIPYYTFQVAVKKPGGCNGDKCQYEVTSISNGENKKATKSFKPNFDGFVSCLKETGVFVNGKINQKKVAPIEFVHEERDITQTSELLYANRGYKGTRYAGKYSTNKIPTYPGCYYFEDIQKGGFKTYSVDDMESFELERLYQKVCNSGNYKLIDSHISDFDQLVPFQNGLIKIRNELILDEVKKLHEIVSESEQLNEVDKAKFKEVSSDFLEHVIKPLKNDLAQLQRLYANPGHSQKENILNSVFGPEKAKAFLGKDPAELKKEVLKEMDAKASELVSYARSPYLTKEDYKKMSSSKSGAPLDDSTWTSAVLDVYEVHNTAFNYGRYSDDFWESHYKDNPSYKKEKRYASGADLDKKISSRMRDKRKKMKRVSEVAANPDVDYGAKYERTKAAVLKDIDRQMMELRQNMMKAQYKVQTMCAAEKAQKYWISQQACVRDAQAQLEACGRQLRALMASREDAIKKYDGMIAEWKEASEDAGVDVAISSEDSDHEQEGGGTFNFNPPNPSRQNIGNHYSNSMEQMRAAQMRAYQTHNPVNANNYAYNMGANMSGNLGWGSNYQYGMMTPPYFPTQGSSGSYYNYQYGRAPSSNYMMNPSMGFYNQQYTGTGGMFNFGAGGMMGGMPGPMNNNPAYSPMAPSTGAGAGGSFSFGF